MMIHELTPVRPAVRAVVRWQSRGSGCGLGFQDARAPAKTSGYIGYIHVTWWHYRGFPNSWPWPDIAIRLRRTLMEIIPVNIDLTQGILLLTAALATKQRPEDLAWQRVGRKALRTLRHCSTQPCCLGPKSKEQKGFICLLNFAQLVGTNTFQTFQTFHYNLYPSVSKSSFDQVDQMLVLQHQQSAEIRWLMLRGPKPSKLI